jgi:hypothetical protein
MTRSNGDTTKLSDFSDIHSKENEALARIEGTLDGL